MPKRHEVGAVKLVAHIAHTKTTTPIKNRPARARQIAGSLEVDSVSARSGGSQGRLSIERRNSRTLAA